VNATKVAVNFGPCLYHIHLVRLLQNVIRASFIVKIDTCASRQNKISA